MKTGIRSQIFHFNPDQSIITQLHDRAAKAKIFSQIDIRWISVENTVNSFQIESEYLQDHPHWYPWLYKFSKRQFERQDKFTVVSVCPTGIGLELSGHSGDGNAAMRLLSSISDCHITHCNSWNAADINEMLPNSVYVEGSTLSRLLMGAISLLPRKQNKILLILDKHDDELEALSINSASAARLGLGAKIDIIRVDPGHVKYLESNGRASATIENLENYYNVINKYKDQYDAFAMSTVLDTPKGSFHNYLTEDVNVNLYGGPEAILTHSLSLFFNRPIAHAPMNPDMDIFSTKFGIVDPPKCAEAVSKTYLHCVLKGLHQSPQIIPHDISKGSIHGTISAEDVNVLIIPDRCIGLPVLAALEQGIKVIFVKDKKNIMQNDVTLLPWKDDQTYFAENYLEAAGLCAAIKAGISPDTVLRPIKHTKERK